MTTSLLSVAAFALLFALAAVLRPRAGCGGDCGHCERSCTLADGNDHV